MSIIDLEKKINEAKRPDGSLIFNGALVNSTDVAKLLLNCFYFSEGDVQISNTEVGLSPDGKSVLVNGKIIYPDRNDVKPEDKLNCAIDIELTLDPQDNVLLILRLVLPEEWTFPKAFPGLNDMPLGQMSVNKARLIVCSKTHQDPTYAIDIPPGMNLVGTLQLEENFPCLAPLFNKNELVIYGSITDASMQYMDFQTLPHDASLIKTPIKDAVLTVEALPRGAQGDLNPLVVDAALHGTLIMGSGDDENGDLSMSLVSGTSMVSLDVSFKDVHITDFLKLVPFIGSDDPLQLLPEDVRNAIIAAGRSFQLKQMGVTFNYNEKNSELPIVLSASIQISANLGSGIELFPPIPQIKATDLDLNWNFRKDSMTFSAQAGISITNSFKVFIGFQTEPGNGYTIYANQDKKTPLKLTELIETLLPDLRGKGLPDVELSDFCLELSPPSGRYSLSAVVSAEWKIPEMPGISLDNVAVMVLYDKVLPSSSSPSISIDGAFVLIPKNASPDEGLKFGISARLPEMEFSGKYLGLPIHYSLSELIDNLFDGELKVPSDLASFQLDDFYISISPKSGIFKLSVTGDASFSLFGTPLLSITDTTFSLQRSYQKEKKSALTATIEGVISIGKIGFQVYAVISNEEDTEFEIHMVNQTVGSLLQYLVRLVDPYFELSLEPPWNALLNISLDALVLKVNVTDGTVYLSYNTNINLGFIDISGLGLIYQKKKIVKDEKTGKVTIVPSSVQISLDCTFLGLKYGGEGKDPLSWDPMRDPAPSVAGKAPLFDLNYLGLGQHITPDIKDEASMVEIIEAMQKNMVPVEDSSGVPAKLPGIHFQRDSHWLIASRFSALGVVEILAIFNDPNLYGIRIALSGEKAGKLKGLEFEILYRKVTPTIGLYHIDLTLPDVMRHLEFGEVSITLPVVVLDLYTNGNFRIDLGFPKGLDFSRSFSIQIFPFVGYGGLYFALLSGETSKKVPQISNGTFDPVIEFGLGLSLGVGKDIDKGPLKAGLSITVVGILEGVLAWFHPNSNDVPRECYYHIQGAVAVVGRLYGSVDFAIIKAEVQVVAYASIVLTVESHRPIYIALEAGVSIKASLKVLFITIHFSFSATIKASFTIGSITTTPWKVVEGGGAGGQKQLSGRPSVHRHLRLGAALETACIDQIEFKMNWSPACVSHLVYDTHELRSLRRTSRNCRATASRNAFGESTDEIRIIISPAFTQAAGQHLAGFDGRMAGNGEVAAQAVLLPLIENSIQQGRNTAREIREVAEDATDSPFVKLASRLLAWTIHARLSGIHSPSPVVTAADLSGIYEQLNRDDIEQTEFTCENLVAFLKNNFLIVFEARRTNEQNSAQETNASVFPILPALTMTHDGATVDFASYNPVNKSYQEKITLYLKQMKVEYENTVESDYCRKTKVSGDSHLRNKIASDSDPSMAAKIFQNYFLMMARTAVQSAMDQLKEYRYSIPSGDSLSLADIAEAFSASKTLYTTTSGDTLQGIADKYGILVSTLKSVNPEVSSKKPEEPLPAGTTLIVLIGALTEITTNKEDTLNSLMKCYQIPIQIIKELNPCVSSLDPENSIPTGTHLLLPVIVTPESIALANQDDAKILQGEKKIKLKGVAYRVSAPDDGHSETLRSIAEKFDKDPDFLKQLLSANGNKAILQEGLLLNFYQDKSEIVYISNDGDTIRLIAAIFSVRIYGPTLYNYFNGLAQMVQDILTRNGLTDPIAPIKPKTTLSIELTNGTVVSYVTNPLDNPTMVAAYFLSLTGGPMDLTDFIQQLIELNELGSIDPDKTIDTGTPLKIPTFSYAIRAGDTLDRIHDLFNVDVGKMADTQNLLQVHATLDIPTFQYVMAEGDTLRGISQKFNLTFTSFVACIVSENGLFNGTITIPRVPARHTTDLIDDLVKNGDLNQAASMISRFMLHGLRLPVNDARLQSLDPRELHEFNISSTIKTGPLYELIGQQFTVPDTAAEGYEICLAATGADWISFGMSSYYALEGTTLGDLSSRFVRNEEKDIFETKIKDLNQGVTYPLKESTWLKFPADMKLKELRVNLTKDEITQVDELRKAEFNPNNNRLQRHPLFKELPLRYSLEKMVPWKAAVMPEWGSAAPNQQQVTDPSIWAFPGELQSRLKGIKEGSPIGDGYELLMSARDDSDFSHNPVKVCPYLWATKVDFRVQAVESSDKSARLPNIYRLIGTDENGRELLQKIYSDPGEIRSYLLYKTAPTSSNAGGMISDKIDSSLTFILRTNLSTLSQSGPVSLQAQEDRDALNEEPDIGEYDAPISNGKDFVKLLWECSVVYSGGYYLNYVTYDGEDLPDYLFAEGSEAILSMLIILGDTDNSPNPLVEAHNCAVVAQNIDASNTSLSVQAISHTLEIDESLDSVARDLNKSHNLNLTAAALAVANKKTKNLLREGAEIELGSGKYPIIYGDTLASIADKNRLTVEDLINIGKNAQAMMLEPGAIMVVGQGQVHQTSTVPAGNTGFQLVRPAPDDGHSDLMMDSTKYLDNVFQLLDYGISPNYRFAASARGLPIGPLDYGSEEKADQEWHYHKILPVYRYAKDGLGSDIASLDPHSALPPMVNSPYRGIYFSPGEGDDQKISLDLCFLDVYGNRTISGTLQPLEIPVGYFDDLIGISGWPSLSASHIVQPLGENVHINIPMRFKISQYIPGKYIPLDNALENACAHRAKYAQILYQIWQPDLIFLLRTSLDQPKDASIYGKSYPDDTINPPRKPYEFSLHQKLTMACTAASIYSFLTACRNLKAHRHSIESGETLKKLAELYGTDINALFRANSDAKADDIFGSGAEIDVPEFETTLQGDTIDAIKKRTGIDITQEYNLNVPLNTGMDLSIPARETYDLQPEDTLRKIADSRQADVAQIAQANEMHLLNEGKFISICGKNLQVTNADTLQSMAKRFKDKYDIDTDSAELGKSSQDIPDLFDKNEKINIDDYVIQDGDTLKIISDRCGLTTDVITENNGDLINLFAPGTGLQIRVTPYVICEGDTLGTIADHFNISLDVLAPLNEAKGLNAKGMLVIPFVVDIDNNALPYSIYQVKEGEKLRDIAGKYLDPSTHQSLNAAALAGLNRNTPYLFQTGKDIEVNGNKTVTKEGDTFEIIYQRLKDSSYQGSFEEFVEAISSADGLFCDKSVLACPPINVCGRSLAEIAKSYGLEELSLIEANSSLSGLLKSGTISYKGKNITVEFGDTFSSLISRFARENVELKLKDIISIDSLGKILNDDALMLAPPIIENLEIIITSEPVNPKQIFPVTVELEIARNRDLVDPDFQDAVSVFQAQTPLAPTTDEKENDGLNAHKDSDLPSQSLTQYATKFEASFKGLIKVATGKSVEEEDSASKRGIWAVDFRPDALSFDIKGYDKISGNNTEAVYFALKPLVNSLVSGEDIEVCPYESGSGLNLKRDKRTFQAIDLDVWAREFLSALDLFLSPEYAIPVCNLKADMDVPTDNDGIYHYRRVMSCKEELARSIGKGLSHVFSDETGDLDDAKEALIQRLLVRLSNAYEIDTVVQLPVDTSSADSDEVLTARLSGKPLEVAGQAKVDESADGKGAYSLSTAKVNLMKRTEPLRLTFLVNVEDKAASKSLKLDLRYAINEIEYDISSVDKIDGYQASSWLTLILPIGGHKEASMLASLPINEDKSLEDRARIGTVSIPIPLRSYPIPASLVDQSMVAKEEAINCNSLKEKIGELTSWKYSYCFDYQSAEQDTLYLKVSFESGNGRRSMRESSHRSLFEQLAQFIYAYPGIKEDLTLLSSPLLKAKEPYALKAAKSAVVAFANIVAGSKELNLEGVSQAWKEYDSRMRCTENESGIVYEYRMSTDRNRNELILDGISSTDGSYICPDIEALVWDAGKSDFVPYSLPLVPMEKDDWQAIYSLKDVNGEPSRYRFTFPDLNIITHQKALSSVHLTRNENLGKDMGKVVEGDFIYQTPIVAFSNSLTPMVISDEEIDIKEGDESLEDALCNLFEYILPTKTDSGSSPESINVEIACRYGYKMSCGKTLLPILLLPRFDFKLSSEWKRSFADELASKLDEWVRSANPSKENGAYYFDIRIFAGNEGVVDQPLLNASNLYYRL